jgi:hypothetical protein
MKIKLDFITNSSSASFTISKQHLTEKQILMIHSHMELGIMLAGKTNKTLYAGRYDAWQITETDNTIMGDTSMDNFDMLWFLDEIGVNRDNIDLEHSND